ncbi:MAG TPA: gluconeogenesis factor YvcK family protein, partial [Ktedonobacterales bacterium]|nr:gluconeogenesis factor YvcK family protein [Ktedonobacterales bacterium]
MRRYQENESYAALGLRGKHVVTIGGGTGPFAVLSSLKHYPCMITAIVTMADSGGSSRRLMDEFGQLPFGDLRQALVALSRNGVLWRDVFTFRFGKNGKQTRSVDPLAASTPGQELAKIANAANAAGTGAPTPVKAQSVGEQAGVSGHSLGNLIISALQDLNGGNLLHAIADAQELLNTAGAVLPVTLTQTTLCAELTDGEVICSETEIDTRGKQRSGSLVPIKRIFLQNPTPPCDEALRAIRRADVIIIGPGDLYTSILPNLLVDGVAEAIR